MVAVLIAWTASERGKAVAPKAEDHGGNARDFAMAVAGEKAGYIAPAYVALSPTPTPLALNAPEPVTRRGAANEEAEARKKAFFQALFATSAISDPVLQQVNNAHQQAISAAEAVKAVRATRIISGARPRAISPTTSARRRRRSGCFWDQRRRTVGSAECNSLSTYSGSAEKISEYILGLEHKREINQTQEVTAVKEQIPYAERTYLAATAGSQSDRSQVGCGQKGVVRGTRRRA